jgi:hypothetical protein
VAGEENQPIAWKSVASGQTDPLLVQLMSGADSLHLDSISFYSDYGKLSAQSISEEDRKQLTVTGRTHQSTEGILASLTQTDSSGQVIEQTVGKVNVISYERLEKKVVLVPLSVERSRSDAVTLENRLNEIYAPAIMEWSVTVAEPLTTGWDLDEDEKLDDGESGLFTNYTREMKAAIQALEQRGTEQETFYVFLAGQAKSSSDKLGYMPRKRRFGFIFSPVQKDPEKLAHTLAHELAHGAFRLEHTFKEYPALSKGSTDNLMDYPAGSRLYKHQWDYIHDPVAMVGWAQDEGDSEYVQEDVIEEFARLLNQIKCTVSSSAISNNLILNTYLGRGSFEISIDDYIEDFDPNSPASSQLSENIKDAKIHFKFENPLKVDAIGYIDVQLKLGEAKTVENSLYKSYIIPTSKGNISVSLHYDDKVNNQKLIDWFTSITGLDKKGQYKVESVDNNKSWNFDEVKLLSKCQLKQFNRANREGFFEEYKNEIESLVGLDKDTYQQVFVTLLNTLPSEDEAYFYKYFFDRPDLISHLYKNMDDRIRDYFVQSLYVLWTTHVDQNQFGKAKQTAPYIITTSIFGNANNSVTLEDNGDITMNVITYRSVESTVTNKGVEYIAITSEKNVIPLPVRHPLEPVLVGFEDPSILGAGKEDSLVILPSIFIKNIADKGSWEDFKDGSWAAFNIGLTFIGVGEVVLAVRAVRTANLASGFWSTKALKASLRASMGLIDVGADISSQFCDLPSNAAKNFCITWKRYEILVGSGLLGAAATETAYERLKNSYQKLEADQAVTITESQRAFFEGEMGFNGSTPVISPFPDVVFNSLDEVNDLSKYKFGTGFVEKDGTYYLTAKAEDGAEIAIKLGDETHEIVKTLHSADPIDLDNINDVSQLLEFASGDVEQVHAICQAAADFGVKAHNIDDEILVIKQFFDGVEGADLVTIFVKGGCFLPETPVSTVSGFKNIEHIQAGDSVWAYNTETGKEELEQVLRVFKRKSDRIYHIALDDDTLHATGEHPFYVNGKWVNARDLQTGEYLFRFGQIREKIRSISIQDTAVNVYNFAVNRLTNYYVGKSKVLVHNSCKTKLAQLDNSLQGVEGPSELRKLVLEKVWLDEFVDNPDLVKAWDILRSNASSVERGIPGDLENLKKLDRYISQTEADISKLKSSYKNTLDPEKWLKLKIPEAELNEILVNNNLLVDPPSKLEAWTPEHKAQRWNNYKEGCAASNNGCLSFESWSNKYDGNINQAKNGDQAVKDYVAAEGLDIPEDGFERTWKDIDENDEILTVSIKNRKEGGIKQVSGKRRHDIYDAEAETAIEVKNYSSGKVYLSEDIEREAMMDIYLLNEKLLKKVVWVFTGEGPSGPLRSLLENNGIIIKLN